MSSPSPFGPWRPVMALLLVGTCVVFLSRICPEEGWNVAGVHIKMPMPKALAPYLSAETAPTIVHRWAPEDVQDLLNTYDAQLTAAESSEEAQVMSSATPADALVSIDSTTAQPDALDTLSSTADLTPQNSPNPIPLDSAALRSPVKAVVDLAANSTGDWIPLSLRVRIPKPAQCQFDTLFARLNAGLPVTVLHFGDSQIEGDRISGTLRHKWQARWGGYGPGIQPPVPLVQSFALSQRHSSQWQRHTRYGRRDTTDRDENYGLLASYATATVLDGDPACLTLQPERRAHASFGQWDGLSVWHDQVAVETEVMLNGLPVDTLRAGRPAGQITWTVPRTPSGTASPAEVCFSATPPRLFAVHPLGAGVQWHAVAMRGSSGTLFRKLHRPTFSKQLRQINPDLVVLQFGGNTVPYCKDSASAERYAGWFGRQIQLFQSLAPHAAILVIGPSDMAQKTGLEWTPYPQLDAVRNALKAVSLDQGAAHWDLLEVMGGLGSMPAWVKATPALAGADHVHLTPLGAKKVGALLDRALWAEFRSWKRGGGQKPMSGLAPRPAQALPTPMTLQHAP